MTCATRRCTRRGGRITSGGGPRRNRRCRDRVRTTRERRPSWKRHWSTTRVTGGAIVASRKRKHEVIDLLRALKSAGIVCSTVSVGGVTLDGILWLSQGDDQPKKPEPRPSMWEQQVEAIRNRPESPKTETPEEALI